MKSLRNEQDRIAVRRRLDALSPEAKPGWGRFTAAKMLCHIADALRMALGDLPTRPHTGRIFTVFPLKHLLLYVIPIPRGVPTAPELLSTAPADFEHDRARCRDLIERFARIPETGDGPRHPLFGALSWRQWGVLQWRHLDHHLRQFGV